MQQHQPTSSTINFGQVLSTPSPVVHEHERLFTPATSYHNNDNITNGAVDNYSRASNNLINLDNYQDCNQTDLRYRTTEIANINGTTIPTPVTLANNQYRPYVQYNANFDTRITDENTINDNPNARDSITLALEEIGAIINGKEFDDLTVTATTNTGRNSYNQHYQEHPQLIACNNLVDYQTGVSTATASVRVKQEKLEPDSGNNNNNSPNFVETQASIYENLKKSIVGYDVEPGAGDSNIFPPSATAPASYMHSNKMTDNNHHDLFARCVANDDIKDPTAMTAQPYVEIIEQPAKCALRFRYKCEGRSAGSLPGVNSTSDNKTYPTIRINNYVGRAVVVVSCVTKDAPYKAHPHNIVGKEGCKKGICTIVLNNNDNSTNGDDDNDNDTGQRSSTSITKSLNGLGIQCVKRKDIDESLSLRESINVDPFRNGFAHKLDASNIDLNVVRLCFQVFIEGTTPNKCDKPLIPVVSDPIHDKKAMSDLIITKLSHCSAPATGGREVILLCDRIAKDDIQIRFFEERDGKLIWETYSDVSPADVHKQVAICLKTPKYYNENITQPVVARIQLRRISDNQVSEPRLFQFLPCESDENIILRKRQKVEWVNMNHYAPSGS